MSANPPQLPPGLQLTEEQRLQLEAGMREFGEAADAALLFHAAGPDPKGTGDFIITGKSVTGISTTAVRLTVVQTMQMIARIASMLAMAMTAEQMAESGGIVAPPGARKS